MNTLFALSLVAYFGWILAQSPSSINYCDPSLCGPNVTNVACTNNTGFGSACVNATQVVLNATLQQTIVQRHNMRRSQVATGNLTGFPSASNMLEMSWDDDLAYVAGFNARTCVLAHDACRSTPAYPLAGQNLAIDGLYNTYLDPTTAVTEFMDLWFNEYEDCPLSIISDYEDSTTDDVGHFTQMVQQKSGRVGCAMVNFMDGHWFQTLLTCNYSYTNIYGGAVYTAGPACSQCATTCSTVNPGLCVDS